jgi:hypothetical protein
MSELADKIKSLRWQRVMFILVMILMVAGADSCKSTGKLSKKERKAQIETAKKQLQSIIDGTSTYTLEEKKRLIAGIMDKNYNDATLDSLIIEAQKKLRAEMIEYDKAMAQKVDVARATLYDLLLNKDNKSAEELQKELNAIKAQKLNNAEIDELIARLEKKIQDMRESGGSGNIPVKTQLENAFTTIANSAKTGNLTQADNTIQKILPLFSSDDAVVLIIISREGSMVDYDKPTTIKRYLNLLRDTKSSTNNVDAIMTDATGKIKELDLIKK